jgi:hypothetical protein
MIRNILDIIDRVTDVKSLPQNNKSPREFIMTQMKQPTFEQAI